MRISTLPPLRARELWFDALLALLFVVCTFVMAGLAAMLVLTCKPAAAPTPEDSATPIARACEALRRAGCPEGSPGADGETCAEHLARVAEVAMVPVDCVADAGSAAAVRACGSANTLTFRCRIDGGTP